MNRAALLAFYAAEEDRREAERLAGMRYEIIGPKLTFLSRTEGSVEKKDKGKGKQELGRRRMIEVLGETGQKGWKGKPNDNGVEEVIENEGGSESKSSDAVDENGESQESTLPSSVNRQRDPNEPLPWARNWLVFDQFEGTRADEYEALFGDHVDWNQPIPRRGGGSLSFSLSCFPSSAGQYR